MLVGSTGSLCVSTPAINTHFSPLSVKLINKTAHAEQKGFKAILFFLKLTLYLLFTSTLSLLSHVLRINLVSLF